MKSLWFWIIGGVVAFWVFSDDMSSSKKSGSQLEYGYRQSPQYQATPRPLYSQPTMGYHCTYDCSGHEAGYEWASENGIDDPDDCDGNSDSFIEGCQAYAEEQQLMAEETLEDEF